MDFNPWQVESIEAFNYYCCPECVYRSQEEFDFQAHALQNHPESRIFFNEPHKYETLEEGVEDEDTGVEVKVEEAENEPLQNDNIENFDEKLEDNEILENTVKLQTMIRYLNHLSSGFDKMISCRELNSPVYSFGFCFDL